jgi:hypothetical protein
MSYLIWGIRATVHFRADLMGPILFTIHLRANLISGIRAIVQLSIPVLSFPVLYESLKTEINESTILIILSL